ncbi:MAG: HK97 family phage prohead protease [Bifidobacteriaceae bacterium]|jgi:HK97 family phage prohead protease|nr:HK97 family phage prohead protease [Bifidobacteriaceae bacterium]
MAGIERRALECAVEWRAATGDAEGVGTLAGYAAKFHSLSRDLGGWAEIVEPGAFGGVDAEGRVDLEVHGRVMARVNHDSNRLIGTTDAGTLRLFVDELGLRYEVDLPATTVGRDLAVLAKRGDVRFSSFAFRVPPDGAKWAYDDDDRLVRHIASARLVDVAPVADPAYWETSSELQRSFDLEAIKASLSREKSEPTASRARIAVIAQAWENTIALKGTVK